MSPPSTSVAIDRRPRKQPPHQNIIVPLGRLNSSSFPYAPLLTIFERNFRSRNNPGGLRPLSLPHPARPLIRQILVALRSNKPHSTILASTSNDPCNTDGSFQWRSHTYRLRKIQTKMKMKKRPLRKEPSLQLTYTTPSPSLSPNLFPDDIITSSDPVLFVGTSKNKQFFLESITPPITPRVSTYKIRVDRSVKVEVKKQAKIDSFHASFDDSHLGGAKVAYVPDKKVSLSFILRQALLTTRSVPPSSSNATSHRRPRTETRVQNGANDRTSFLGVTSITNFVQPWRNFTQSLKQKRLPSLVQTTKPAATVSIQSDNPRVTRTRPKSSPSRSSTTAARSTSSSRKRMVTMPTDPAIADNIANGRRSMKMDAEYVWKEKRCTVNTAFEGADGQEMSLRVMNNPWRFIPRIRTRLNFGVAPSHAISVSSPLSSPLSSPSPSTSKSTKPPAKNSSSGNNVGGGTVVVPSDVQHPPWICWMPELGSSWAGEVQVGWKDMAVLNIWKKGLLGVSRRKKDGSGYVVTVMAGNKSGKFEKTIVRKAMKGKVSVLVNGVMGNQRDQTGITVSLNNELSTFSVYGRTSRSFGVSMDSNFYVRKHHFCRVAVRTENFKSASIRLGWFY